MSDQPSLGCGPVSASHFPSATGARAGIQSPLSSTAAAVSTATVGPLPLFAAKLPAQPSRPLLSASDSCGPSDYSSATTSPMLRPFHTNISISGGGGGGGGGGNGHSSLGHMSSTGGGSSLNTNSLGAYIAIANSSSSFAAPAFTHCNNSSNINGSACPSTLSSGFASPVAAAGAITTTVTTPFTFPPPPRPPNPSSTSGIRLGSGASSGSGLAAEVVPLPLPQRTASSLQRLPKQNVASSAANTAADADADADAEAEAEAEAMAKAGSVTKKSRLRAKAADGDDSVTGSDYDNSPALMPTVIYARINTGNVVNDRGRSRPGGGTSHSSSAWALRQHRQQPRELRQSRSRPRSRSQSRSRRHKSGNAGNDGHIQLPHLQPQQQQQQVARERQSAQPHRHRGHGARHGGDVVSSGSKNASAAHDNGDKDDDDDYDAESSSGGVLPSELAKALSRTYSNVSTRSSRADEFAALASSNNINNNNINGTFNDNSDDSNGDDDCDSDRFVSAYLGNKSKALGVHTAGVGNAYTCGVNVSVSANGPGHGGRKQWSQRRDLRQQQLQQQQDPQSYAASGSAVKSQAVTYCTCPLPVHGRSRRQSHSHRHSGHGHGQDAPCEPTAVMHDDDDDTNNKPSHNAVGANVSVPSPLFSS